MLSLLFERCAREAASLARCASRSVSGLAFANGHLSAGLILAATACCPRFLACGILALLAAWSLARFLGFSCEQLGIGILRNAFLTGLAVAWISLYWEWTSAKWPWLAIGAGGLSMIVSAAAEQVIGKIAGLPPMNTGFLVVASALFTIHGGKNLADPALIHSAILTPEPSWLPDSLLTLGRAFGVICFIPNATVGVLVALAILVRSRLTFYLGVAGWLGGLWANHSFQYLAPWSYDAGVFVYNSLLVGMAISAFFVASRSAYLLAFIAGAFAMFLWHAITAFFAHWAAAQILSISFLLTTWAIISAMRQRVSVGTLMPMPVPGMKPEVAALQAAEYGLRFPSAETPILDLPFVGIRSVTQSQNGEITHRGAWRHAVDFEVRDESNRPAPPGSRVAEAFYTFGTAVLAPISGTVVRVVNDVPDNPIGETNFEQNWGNLIVIQSSVGFHVLLAHFRQHSIAVYRGQWIEGGQYLGQCGNSGRSPIPHLHVHCQSIAEPGAPTIPFLFRNYVDRANPGESEWHQFGLPSLAARVERFESDAIAASLLQGWKQGKTAFTMVSPTGVTERRTLEISFTEEGFWHFRVPEESAECRGCAANSGLRLFDLRARRQGLLTALFFGISTVPFTGNNRIYWREKVPGPSRLWHRSMEVQRKASTVDEGVRIEVSAESKSRSCVATIDRIYGLRRLVLETPKGLWTASAIAPASANQPKETSLAL